jgi:hypothetical protein
MFYSREFLDELFLNKDRELYVRITLLTWDELKIKEIQGLVVDGSLNVDGNSIIRRTLNLTMALDEDSFYLHETVHEITISRKIQVHIGLKNNTQYGRFPDSVSNNLKFLAEPIIWFNLGVFVPTDVSLTHDIENSSVSISGQDKMVLLNGDVSGQLGYDIDFVNTITKVDLPYQTIIKDSVSYFGGIDSSKVLVLDVPFYAESLTTIPSSEFTFVGSGIIGSNQITFDSSTSLTNLQVGQTVVQVLTREPDEGELPAGATISSISSNSINISSNIITAGGFIFYVTPATLLYSTNVNNYGKRTFDILNGNPITSGTLLTPPLEPGKIIPLQFTLSPKNKDTAIEVSSTDNVTTILDKVKSDLLGQYEYFFDVDGNFIFQFSRNLESEFDSTELFQNDIGNKYLADFTSIPYVYDFSNKEIISSYNNTPNWKGIKNDFYVYGAKNLLYHLAIDTIPRVPTEFYEQASDGTWTSTLIPYNQPWQQYIIDLTEYNAQENPDIPENKYYAELIKYFRYDPVDNTGIYWKQTPTTGIWRSDNKGEVFDFNLIVPSFEVEYLLIAGGGGGSKISTVGGGGGAGGYLAGALVGRYNNAISLTVGSGGAAGNNANGSTGGDSILSTITAKGGGGGAAGSGTGLTGGSGGGGGGADGLGGTETVGQGFAGGKGTQVSGTYYYYNFQFTISSGPVGSFNYQAFQNGSPTVFGTLNYTGGSQTFFLSFTWPTSVTYTLQYTFNGATTPVSLSSSGSDTQTNYYGGGGGGAGGIGGDAIISGSSRGGTGGAGLSSPITGTSVGRAGGGGGGNSGLIVSGFGGGTGSDTTAASSGVTNTGGGGGGSRTGNAGAGGSGVVILRYPSIYRDIFSISGLTYTKTTFDAYTIYTFTQGTGTITF